MHNESTNHLTTPGLLQDGLPSAIADQPTSADSIRSRGLWRSVKFLTAAVLCGIGVGAAVYFLRPVNIHGQPEQSSGQDTGKGPPLFAGWTKPELALVVSGQEHGYWQRCGCSDPQLGGLTRRFNFMNKLREKGWPLVAVDIGEIAEEHGPQATLKYEYSMKSLSLMKYDAVGLGKTEFNMPLPLALGQFALKYPSPTVLATNLIDPNQNFELQGVHKFKIVNVKPQLAFFSVVDAKIAKEIKDSQCNFVSAPSELASVMQTHRASVNILIYQGDDKEVGKFLADFNAIRVNNKKIPELPIILCLSADSEPPPTHKRIGNTTIVSVGHKGRHVGVLGLFPNPNNVGYFLRYELVPIGEEYDTPNNLIANHEVMKLWEDYAKIVQEKKFIEKFPRSAHPLQVELKRLGLETHYVGSQRCKKCHEDAFAEWQKSAHSHAFASLENAKNPSRRQFDGECVQCHTVGFKHNTGYLDNPGLNEMLKNVGCESCHGPASAHLVKVTDTKIHQLMNPYSTKRRIPAQHNTPALVKAYVDGQFKQQDFSCQKCHDTENDVNYIKHDYQHYWKKIQHYTPPAAPAPMGGAAAVGDPNPSAIRINPIAPGIPVAIPTNAGPVGARPGGRQ